MKITITRALAELKVLNKRFEKEVTELGPFAVSFSGKLTGSKASMTLEAYENSVKAEMQSIEDIYKRIVEIKTAIDRSNSLTKITVGGVEYTVQEALVQKKYIDLKKNYLEQLKIEWRNANMLYQNKLNSNENNITSMFNNLASSDKSTKTEAIESLRKVVEATCKVEFIDPCNSVDKMKELEAEIVEFEKNIDFILSESNSLTYIEISD